MTPHINDRPCWRFGRESYNSGKIDRTAWPVQIEPSFSDSDRDLKVNALTSCRFEDRSPLVEQKF